MAEEESELELDRLKEELDSLLDTSASDEHGPQSKSYCARFCELVEGHTGRWQVPLPQLEVLRRALCSFVRGAASFPSDCEHVRYTLSSLALSVFELLLFFGENEFPEDPLKDILDSFQDCHSSLVRHQNVHLLQVRQIIKDGGPWASPVLQSILQETGQLREEVDRYLSSEVSVFFELRVRYLLACERIREAMSLAKSCIQHPTAGRHLFFLQAYLTGLWKASLYERLHKEMAEIDGKDAVEVICISEDEEKDEMLLALCRGFLSQQLRSGDMYYLWDLVFIWSKLHLRVNPSKQDFLEDCQRQVLSATNVKSIFPFMKVILAELGKDGLRFCMELCARALQTDLQNDPVTKSLLYKTVAYLLPNDLEVCRACALLVFFLERTVESYKTVFLLYNHPDQEYHGDSSPVGNHVRFEVLQVLKKGLFFDPEFWNLFNLRINCLKLLSDKVAANAAIGEIMEEEKWMPNCCVREPCKCRWDVPDCHVATNQMAGHPGRGERRTGTVVKRVKRVKPPSDEASSAVPPKRRGRKPGPQPVKVEDSSPVRRSFRQLDIAQENMARQLSNRRQRLLTRQAERKTLKRRGRKPRWLLEEAAQAENSAPGRGGRRPGRKPQQQPPVEMRTYERSPGGHCKDTAIDISQDNPGKDAVLPRRLEFSGDGQPVTPIHEVMLELSLPDNEVVFVNNAQSLPASKDYTGKSEMQTHKPSSELCMTTALVIPAPAELSIRHQKAEESDGMIFLPEDALRLIRKLHSYSKSREVQGIVNDTQPSEIRPAETPVPEIRPAETPVPARPLEGPGPMNNPPEKPCEPTVVETVVEVEVTTHTPAEIMETSTAEVGAVEPKEDSVSDGEAQLKEILGAPVEDEVIPDNTVTAADDDNVNVPKDAIASFTDDTTTPVPDTIIPVPDNTPQIPENIPSVPTEVVCVFNGATDTAVPPDPEQEQKQEPVASQNTEEVSLSSPATSVTASTDTPQETERPCFVHRCSLCNKAFKGGNVMRHAMAHFRNKKCMFCENPPDSLSAAFMHFSIHIKRLKEGEPAGVIEACELIVPEVPKVSEEPTRPVLRSGVREKLHNAGVKKRRPYNRRCLLVKKSEGVQASKEGGKISKFNKKSVQRVNGTIVRKKHRIKRTKEESSSPTDEKAQMTAEQQEKTGPEQKEETREQPNVKTEAETGAQQKHETGTEQKKKTGLEQKKKTGLEQKKKTGLEQKKKTGVEQKKKTGIEQKKKTGVEQKKKTGVEQNKKTRVEQKKKTRAEQKNKTRAEQKEKTEVQQQEITGVEQTDNTGTEQKDQTGAEQKNKTGDEQKKKTGDKQKKKTGDVQKKKPGAEVVFRCPATECALDFGRRRIPVLTHILQVHPDDTKFLEFAFDIGKGACLLCCRKFRSFLHFADHVEWHKGSHFHPCLHHGCTERFQSLQNARDHMKSHQPLEAACCFPGCPIRFPQLIELQHHERDHYRVRKPKIELEDVTQPRVCYKPNTDQKDGKQARILKLPSSPLDLGKSEDPNTIVEWELTEGTEMEGNVRLGMSEGEKPLDQNVDSLAGGVAEQKLVNGHCESTATGAPKAGRAFQEEDSSYGKNSRPFIRPSPCLYLDEKFISMPKRRKESLGGARVSPTRPSPPSIASAPQRQRCTQCFTCFNSAEELQAHLSQNKCTSLFGFDSDEESAC